MAFKKRFVVSTEAVNAYNFWVRTEGISLDNAKVNCPAYFNHETWKVPLGHWENISLNDNGELEADLIIEGANEEEKTFIRKIENGDIKGASVGLDVIEWKSEAMWLKANATAPALWKSELFEISITPLPANKSAIALKGKDGVIRLSAANVGSHVPQLLQKQDTDMKAIALKLGLPETATENEILAAIGNIQLSNKQAEDWQKELLKNAEEGLEDDAKAIFVTLCKANPSQALTYAAKQKEAVATTEEVETPGAGTKVKKDVTLSSVINSHKRNVGGAAEDGKDCYDYLQKHNAAELSRIHREDPEKYAQLAADYGKGVRYKGK